MKVTVTMETAGRRGKQVTVIKGITHNPQVIDKLLKKLKTGLGTGGTVKGKTLELQGDHVPKVKSILQKEGYEI
ncbi:translation initiation factor [Balneola sp. MJW-20]|uniref:translation initiation factor n=1 Tax=Gracilimonas aurantiaca TaxID=3234185 RepID=UPI0034673E9F